ncbi:hypothetical protein BAOM_3011 [Peribacillus asahii]|uniref:Treble clef zinc finger domain-containing protein n=1 Tax=Peribacillus asahii TaxID=228899 RepID=A0A3Q9RP90_9BACI|nr:zinc-ribbon domain-containing protein [Peribacillus asahii]AZV43620.1 hypothetical protein BAOM_3011 [Peribacillus asahii]
MSKLMAILEKEILVEASGMNIKHYEEIGYTIPRQKDRKGRLNVKKGTKILVKVTDLPRRSSTLVTKICDECGKHIGEIAYASLMANRNKGDGIDRCRKCAMLKNGINRKENVPYEKSLDYFAKTNNKEYLLEEFSDKNDKKPENINYCTTDEYLWICNKCKSEFVMQPAYRSSGGNCPYCIGRKVNHTNCLWTTHPEIAKLLKNKERGYEVLSTHSKSLEILKCDKCGYESEKIINHIRKYGFVCPKCSDAVSYPEKFMASMLDQINIEHKKEKTFEWSKVNNSKKRYDFYIPSLNCIVETHGKQHYDGGFEYHNGGKTLEEERKNDLIKKELAINNGIQHYIIIDCRESSIEYIKSNIMSSDLSVLLNLNEIDWLKCHEYACNSMVKAACDLWNEGVKSTSEIKNKLSIGKGTALRYLKQGAELGWCDYDPKKVSSKARSINGKINGKKKSKKVVQLSPKREFINEFESMEAARIATNAKNIPAVCKGIFKSSGGFLWMYKEDYEKNKDYLLSLPEVQVSRERKVIQLSLNGEFIKEWSSVKEATSISHGIRRVCKGRQKTAGGYKWMYKEDYDNIYKSTNKGVKI